MLPSIARQKVLLVDDDVLTLECFNLYLSQQQAEVKIASSVAEALGHLRNWTPNFIVTDLSLPVEDGYGLIKKIRAAVETKSVPVIVMTGYETDQVKQQVGNDQFITPISKPVDPEYLLSLLKKIGDNTDSK